MTTEVATTEEMEKETPNSYNIRPNFNQKFRVPVVFKILKEYCEDFFDGKKFESEEVTPWNKQITDDIKTKVLALDYPRYKVVVTSVIGEQRGEGVKMALRCYWDSDTDNYAKYLYNNDSMFCLVAVFAVYFY